MCGYQPKVGWHRVIVWSQDTNHTDTYKGIHKPNLAPVPPSNYNGTIIVHNQTRYTISKSDRIIIMKFYKTDQVTLFWPNQRDTEIFK